MTNIRAGSILAKRHPGDPIPQKSGEGSDVLPTLERRGTEHANMVRFSLHARGEKTEMRGRTLLERRDGEVRKKMLKAIYGIARHHHVYIRDSRVIKEVGEITRKIITPLIIIY